MIKRLLAVTLLLGLGQCMLAQAPPQRRNEIHITALGPGGIGSIGYSRTISRPESRLIRTQIGITTGMSIGSYEEDAWLQVSILPELNTVWFTGRHHLEIGLLIPTGFSINEGSIVLATNHLPIPNYRIGWRIERPESRGFFRMGISSCSWFIMDDPWYWPLMPYIGAGFKF